MAVARGIVVVLTVLAGLLVGTSAAEAASSATFAVEGLEYAATPTEGRFGGAARGPAPGFWQATVVHDELQSDAAVPITGGSFMLYGRGGPVAGTFTDGSVTPDVLGPGCENERFTVAGMLALQGGGRGAFEAVLTHLLVQTDSGCQIYGATVVGSLKVPAQALVA
jgi:hypothetical protein